MKRRAHAELNGSFRATLFEHYDSAVNCVRVACDYYLRGRIDIRGATDLALSGFFTRPCYHVYVGAEDRGHRSASNWDSLLHVAATRPHSFYCVTRQKPVRGNQRRIFAEAVSGHESWRRKILSLHSPQRRDRGRQNCWLRSFRQL